MGPIGASSLAFAALTHMDYYEAPLEKHLAWIGFHGALGASMAGAARFLFRASDPRRYVMQDMFVLLAYNFGYSLIPYLMKD